MSDGLDMRDAVELCSVSTTIRRTSADMTVTAEGLAVPGAVTEITIQAMVHPAPREVMERLPEGQRTRNPKIIYTTDELQVVSGDRRGDVVMFQGDEYEVTELGDWSMGQFYEAIALRVDR